MSPRKAAQRQKFLRKRTVFRLWDVDKGQWWAPEYYSSKRANDLYLTEHTAKLAAEGISKSWEDRVRGGPRKENLAVVECELVPKDPFYRELIERQLKAAEKAEVQAAEKTARRKSKKGT